jgi:hypothetical protein
MARAILVALIACLPASGLAQQAARPELQTRQLKRLQVVSLPCVPTMITVTPGIKDAPPGAFASLAEAIHYSEAHALCGVSIDVSPGSQTGEFLITRSTTIRGHIGTVLAGSVLNPGGLDLVLEDLTVASAPDTAILQSHGHLTMRNVTVLNTRRQSAALRSGTAVELHSGVAAELSAVTLKGNEGVALYLDGKGTVVKATELTVKNNFIHPQAKETFAKNGVANRVAAVEVAGEAELYVDRYDISDNEMCGVLVRSRGAAHLRSGTIAGTRTYKPSWATETFGGDNVTSRGEARIELTAFASVGAGRCGLQVWSAYLKTLVGEVHDNVLGVCSWQPLPGFDPARCVLGNTVRVYNNGSNLPGSTVSVPDPACSLPNPPPTCDSSGTTCPGVPWR